MKLLRRLSGPVLALLLVCLLVPCARAEGETRSVTVLFTHDLHSHFLPRQGEDGGESGGYARLMTALERERREHPEALTLDGGDFSIGSLIQTLFTTQAAELRTMGAMGYDAVTLGNHEFDHQGAGFGEMLNAAVLSGDPLPAIVEANYRPSPDNPDLLDIQRAIASYGVKNSILLERGGIVYGIFGLMGRDSHDCAPASGFLLEDAAQAARQCVKDLRSQGAQFIICLSHSGTDEKKKLSEDERLAEAVDGIDLIVSGHTHTTLAEPIVVKDTYIVSAGPYCQNLGSITLEWQEDGKKTLADYRLVPIDETLPEDPKIAALVETWKAQVGAEYLARYGLNYDQALTRTEFDLPAPQSGVQEGSALGELVADSFLWAVLNLEADAPNAYTVAVTADGVLRAPLYSGDITASMAFDVLSMGVGSDGTSGFPLVGVYLTGKELKAIAEVDASITPLMPAAQLYMSGIIYSFNTHRMFFNRVTEVLLNEPSLGRELAGGLYPIEDDRLYRVVTGMYSAQMLGTVQVKSMGLLSLQPKMKNGAPVTDFEACILRDANGNEIKEWYALAAYLQSFGEEGLPERYAAPDGRKKVSRSWDPIELVKNPNCLTLAALAVILALAVLAVFLVRKIIAYRRDRRYGRRRRGFGRRR